MYIQYKAMRPMNESRNKYLHWSGFELYIIIINDPETKTNLNNLNSKFVNIQCNNTKIKVNAWILWCKGGIQPTPDARINWNK